VLGVPRPLPASLVLPLITYSHKIYLVTYSIHPKISAHLLYVHIMFLMRPLCHPSFPHFYFLTTNGFIYTTSFHKRKQFSDLEESNNINFN
jgi:hypothetical protein